MSELKRLRVFLCHASNDKPVVRQLYQQLTKAGVDAWLDEIKILAGQNWHFEIQKALQESDAIIICLSKTSVSKEGYVQREIKDALEKAKEKPSGTIFVIPVKLDDCDVPSYLREWHWVDIFSENGNERLMRSLHARAENVGAVLGDLGYSDDEVDQRIEQLFTEGLAAFYMDDWDKAYHRFLAVTQDRPNHVRALEKLNQVNFQRHLQELYTQAQEAQKKENWQVVIEILEKLTKEAADYKDANALLRAAQKQKQLSGLYKEALRLYRAQQWHAAVRVFKQITTIAPDYQDVNKLLLIAEKEAGEVDRLNKIDATYTHAVHEIDLGNWQSAHELFKQINAAQPGFRETAQLLQKLESEFKKIEDKKKRENQIATLYEQARELVRLKKWKEANSKLEEVFSLDDQFSDPANITEFVKSELKREQVDITRQSQLAVMYSEAVRLVQDRKYDQALRKWQEIKTLDPKYPDRQKIQRIINKELTEHGRNTIIQLLQKYLIPASILAFIMIASLASSIILATKNIINQTPEPTESMLTRVEDEKDVPMLLVPGGAFMMGSNITDIEDERPLHEVSLQDFYIDQYEVTNARYKVCEQSGVCSPPHKNSSKTHPDSYYSNQNFDKYPVVYVDWGMAKTYCEWRGARLPTEAEWEKAARGTDSRTYPWGNDAPACYLANYITCPQVDTQEVTKYASGKSPYGLYNMVGNVWEWVADWYTADYYQNSPHENPTGPSSGFSRVIRGSAFYEQPTDLHVTNRLFRSPTISDYDIGFRCARSVSAEFP